MVNISIKKAFERFWQHTVAEIGKLKIKTNLTITQNITNTLVNSGDAKKWVSHAECQEANGICFIRVFCITADDMSEDTAYVIGTLANMSYAPEENMPLSVMCGKHVQAYIEPTGNIIVKPYENTYGNIPVRVAGFWFCK